MAFGWNLAEAFKGHFGLADDYDDDAYYEEDDYVEEQKPAKTKSSKRGLGKISPFNSKRQESAYDYEVVCIKPQSINDMDKVADCLVENKIVMLNTEDCDEGLSQRVLDFACGASYSLNGNFAQSSVRRGNSTRGIYVITPESVNVSGAFEDLMMADE